MDTIWWCDGSSLIFNTKKMEEIVLGLRSVRDRSPVIHDKQINNMCSYKNLVIHLERGL